MEEYQIVFIVAGIISFILLIWIIRRKRKKMSEKNWILLRHTDKICKDNDCKDKITWYAKHKSLNLKTPLFDSPKEVWGYIKILR